VNPGCCSFVSTPKTKKIQLSMGIGCRIRSMGGLCSKALGNYQNHNDDIEVNQLSEGKNRTVLELTENNTSTDLLSCLLFVCSHWSALAVILMYFPYFFIEISAVLLTWNETYLYVALINLFDGCFCKLSKVFLNCEQVRNWLVSLGALHMWLLRF
jgi:hypothetical protein